MQNAALILAYFLDWLLRPLQLLRDEILRLQDLRVERQAFGIYALLHLLADEEGINYVFAADIYPALALAERRGWISSSFAEFQAERGAANEKLVVKRRIYFLSEQPITERARRSN